MLNGHGPRRPQAPGAEDFRSGPTEGSANRLIEELAGLLKEQSGSDSHVYGRVREHAHDRGGMAPGAATAPSHADRDDELAVPIPSSWVKQPTPTSDGGWLSDQVRAALLGFGVGLVIVLPMVLLLTGQFGQFAFLQSMPGVKSAGSTTTTSTIGTPPKSETVTRAPSGSEPVASAPVTTAAAVPAMREPAVGKSEPAWTAAPPAQTQVASLPPTQAQAASPPPVQAQQAPVQATVVVPAQPLPAPAREPDIGAALLLEGRQLVDNGDVAGARQVLSRAVATQPVKPEALFALAETYDPNMLAAWGTRAVTADVQRARMLYANSLDGGFEKARARLEALN